MSQKIIDNWLSLAKYDLATAADMLKSKRYLYVAFMCQQSIEKVLKASYVKQHTLTPPYTHNLLRLIKELIFKDELSNKMMTTIEELNSYYIEARYTEDIEELTKFLTETKAVSILDSTKELFEWFKVRI
jgi:HEPN domain-containing protein